MSTNHQVAPAIHPSADIQDQLQLRCPACAVPLEPLASPEADQSASCSVCGHQLQCRNGIWRALAPERAAHFERFIIEYQTVRSAEKRGSKDSSYYLALPYRDLSGVNQGQWAIRAKTFRYIEKKIFPSLEGRQKAPMKVLDLGAGNGWLSYRLALRGHKPAAVDLLTNVADGLAAAEHFRGKLSVLFPRFHAELDNLPFASRRFDLAIFNASFHYSEDYRRTLGEAIRCLRPGGVVIIADTAWYSREESGLEMVLERQAAFRRRFGFASDAINSQEFLTDARLLALEKEFGIRWQIHRPFYGFAWTMRPFVAKLRRRREPSKFRLYVAEATE